MLYRVSFTEIYSVTGGVKTPPFPIRGHFLIDAEKVEDVIQSFTDHFIGNRPSRYALNIIEADDSHDTDPPPMQISEEILASARQPIPPDPDGHNEKDADRAQRIIDAFAIGSGGDDVLGAVELLVILRHWCDRRRESFTYLVEQSATAYRFTTEGD